jgi:predicted nucleic acid-binding protein
MKIVVDTNVAMSAILNPSGKIGALLLSNNKNLEFFAPNLLKVEINRHKVKLMNISKLETSRFEDLREQVLSPRRFISEDQIPFHFWQNSIPFVRDIDMDDIAFIALADYLEAILWTGDKKLLNGIIGRGYKNAFETDEIVRFSKSF